MTFFSVPQVPSDPILGLMNAYNNDSSADKIDVSVGVYKTEDGDPNYIFPCVALAKKKLAEKDPGHCYTQMSGIPEFVGSAQQTVFGLKPENVASVQAVLGSGSLHLAFAFLVETGLADFYVGTPAWSNYKGMIEHAGGVYHDYNYYDADKHQVDMASLVATMKKAPAKSVFVLQAVCHNPTGTDLSKEQWTQVLDIVEERQLVALFDIAYQGFASGDVDEDAWAIREAYRRKLEFLVCQSYSKNMGLYSERVGCTHVCLQDAKAVGPILSQLVAIVRLEFSFAPAFGARVSTIVQQDADLRKIWAQDVLDVTQRLKSVRKLVLQRFQELQTPGNWDHVTALNGLFWYSGLTPNQCEKLVEEHHVYGTTNSRVNVAGLNKSNIDAYCRAVDAVVRKYPS